MELKAYKLELQVNLDIISKYHDATKFKRDTLFKKKRSTTEFLTTINFVLGLQDEDEVHPAYGYFHISEDIISKEHSNNLLFLVQSLIEWEWKVFNETIIDGNTTKDISIDSDINYELPIYDLLFNCIRDLRSLIRIHESRVNDLIQIKEGNKKKIPHLQLNYTNLNKDHLFLNINDSKAVEDCEKLLISHYFEKLKDYAYFMCLSTNQRDLTKILAKMSKPNIDILDKLEQTLVPNEITFAKSLFRKLVCQKIVQYLKSENIIINPPDVEDGTKQQAEIIYPLLCLFNLIDKERILKHTNSRKRDKFIRAILQNTYVSKKEDQIARFFPEIQLEQVVKKKSSKKVN